ncbi:hypothetical protein Hanom_Chr11g01039721 [Helianthus anomalus]
MLKHSLDWPTDPPPYTSNRKGCGGSPCYHLCVCLSTWPPKSCAQIYIEDL